jgi:hypothetical protein
MSDTSGALPPELFTKGNVSPPNTLYEELAEEFPQHVRRNADGEWEIDVWQERGVFSPAIKAFHARSAANGEQEGDSDE